jgi:tRNA wybutosine-synthesizing protein 3
MSFDEQKEKYLEALYKPDRSKKGGVDEYVSNLINFINHLPNFYTTSSCSGRISLFTCEDFTKKYTANWLFVSHKTISLDDCLSTLKQPLPSQNIWFRQESFILHVCARTIEDAKKFVVFAQLNGFKHTGIIALGKRIIIEVIGTQRIAAPVVCEGELVVSENYLSFLVNLANNNLVKVHEGIDRFFNALRNFK